MTNKTTDNKKLRI